MKLIRIPLLALMATLALAPVAASARDKHANATTKLQRCGDQTCLVVSGRRSDPTAPVMIEQHEVAVSGAKHWRVSLPLHTVRSWSAPAARAISIRIAGSDDTQTQAALPIGVFGGTTTLAFLSVGAH